MLVFDDSYEHEVFNKTDEERVVLLIRFWHPEIPPNDRSRFVWEAQKKKAQATEKRYHPPV